MKQLLVFGLIIALCIVPVMAAPVVVVDDQGPDDEPGQKDLSQLTVEYTLGLLTFSGWNWDDTSSSGANTRDACTLFDTDNDLNANYSLCVIVNATGGSEVKLYSCDADSRQDRCGGPTEITTISSTCTASVVANSDPFAADPLHDDNSDCSTSPVCFTSDTVASCTIDLDDVGGSITARLLNVCSYPSQEPNSDPSDCVVTEPLDPCDGVDCDDDNVCNGLETCDPTDGSCDPGTILNCDDGDACNDDSCDPTSGCINTAISCDDQDACTDDRCDSVTGCVNTVISCDDSNACTDDSCDPTSGCVNTAIGCDDQDACTVDTCDTQGCQHSAIYCDDGNECTDDTCDPTNGCINTNSPPGTECSIGECDGNGNCGGGTPVPEFPTLALPVTLIIGFLGAVLFIQKTRK